MTLNPAVNLTVAGAAFACSGSAGYLEHQAA